VPPIDKADQSALYLVTLLIMALVIIVDVVLLVRWLIYQVQLNNAEGQLAPVPVVPPLPEQQAAEPLPVPQYATVGAPPAAEPDGEARPVSEAEERMDLPPPLLPPVPALANGLPRPPFAPTWSLVHPFVGFQVAMVLITLITMALLVTLHPHNYVSLMASGTFPPDMTILMLVVQNVFFVGVPAFFFYRYGTSLKRIGLAWPGWMRIVLGVVLGFALLSLANGIEAGLLVVLKHALPASTLQHLEKFSDTVDAGSLFPHMPSVWLKIAFILTGAVAAPIGEEVFFRGFVYNALKARLNVPIAIVLSGLIFALAHFNPLALVPIWLMGSLLAFTYERTRSLWVTILMHAVNNGSAFAALWFTMRH